MAVGESLPARLRISNFEMQATPIESQCPILAAPGHSACKHIINLPHDPFTWTQLSSPERLWNGYARQKCRRQRHFSERAPSTQEPESINYDFLPRRSSWQIPRQDGSTILGSGLLAI